MKIRTFIVWLAAVSCSFAGAALAQGTPVSVGGFPDAALRIIVPASAGGGFDGTARAIQEVLREDKITTQPVEVINATGGSGTVGLSRLLNQHKGDGHYVMVMGLSLVGGMHTAKSPLNLNTVVPLARLTSDYQALAVPNNSRFKTLKDLIDELKKSPKSVVIAGGPSGGPDHLFVGYMARTLGLSAKEVSYVAFSGGDLRPQVMGGHVAAGVASFSELKADAEGGLMRVLAIAAPSRLPGSKVPTAKEAGFDLTFANWRGVIGSPGMKANEREAWIQMLTRMRNSDRWKAILKKRDWNDTFQAGDEYAAYLKGEYERVGALVQELGFVK